MYFKVKVTPGAKRAFLTREAGDRFQIGVRETARENLANKEALAALAAHLRVPAGQLRIITGHHSPHKLVHLLPPRP